MNCAEGGWWWWGGRGALSEGCPLPGSASVNKPDTRGGGKNEESAREHYARLLGAIQTRSRRFNQQIQPVNLSVRGCSDKTPHKSAMHAGFSFELMRTKRLAPCAVLGTALFPVRDTERGERTKSPPSSGARTMSPVSVMHCLLSAKCVGPCAQRHGGEEASRTSC